MSKVGRPKLTETLRKNHSIKFTDQEWQQLQQLSSQQELTVSEYVRNLIKKEIDNNDHSGNQ